MGTFQSYHKFVNLGAVQIYFLMVAIVIYNPETLGLEDREMVNTIRQEFVTMLKYIPTYLPSIFLKFITLEGTSLFNMVNQDFLSFCKRKK